MDIFVIRPPKNKTQEEAIGHPTSSWHDCEIEGEGMGDNPVDCFAFIDSNERVHKGRTLDCCWTANETSELPSRLKNLVTIHPDGAFSLLYSKFEFCIFQEYFEKFASHNICI